MRDLELLVLTGSFAFDLGGMVKSRLRARRVEASQFCACILVELCNKYVQVRQSSLDHSSSDHRERIKIYNTGVDSLSCKPIHDHDGQRLIAIEYCGNDKG